MSWWEAVLWTVGVIGFWPLLIVVGDPIDRLWQRRQDARLWTSFKLWEPK